jgi:phosphomannomutase/phosphoglucomutase
MDHNVYREYDIRGVVGQEIEERDVPLLGKSFASYMSRQQKSRVVVGRDCRHSSERFRDLLIEGLLSAGMDVVDVGICPRRSLLCPSAFGL